MGAQGYEIEWTPGILKFGDNQSQTLDITVVGTSEHLFSSIMSFCTTNDIFSCCRVFSGCEKPIFRSGFEWFLNGFSRMMEIGVGIKYNLIEQM